VTRETFKPQFYSEDSVRESEHEENLAHAFYCCSSFHSGLRMNFCKLCKVSGLHSGDYGKCRLLGSDAAWRS
jgi:hypothetical protein